MREVFKKIFAYLTFRKQNAEGSTNLKIMHGINRISIFMFAIAVVVMVYRCVR